MRARVALLVMLLLAGSPAGAVMLSDCRLPRPGGGSVPARCGVLTVPEDYASAGRTIDLKIAVVPASEPSRATEPVFILAGGPGQAATEFYALAAPAFAPVNRRHALVLLDQRGTGGSNRLDCDFPDDLAVVTPPPEELTRLSAACLAKLPGRPQFYTTSVAIRDLDAVRAALGHETLSFYAVSYGTRVAQHYLRRYPSHVRAVILDGVVPPQTILGESLAQDAQRALELIYARCAAQPSCRAVFPDPAGDYAAFNRQLASAPLRLSATDPSTGAPTTVAFGPDEQAGTVRLLSYTATTSALIPLLLHEAKQGRAQPLAAQLLMFSRTLDVTLAYGMHNSVACSEDVPFFGPPDPSLARTYLGRTEYDSLVALCKPWPRGLVDADLHAPLRARVPALILAGEVDPISPPAFAIAAAQGFPDHKLVVVRGQGHGQIAVGCTPELMARFLAASSAIALDTTCLDAAAPTPFFIDFAGPPP
jgi:pimeloyl-ACP methyl ester carboxylesterase